MLPIAGRRLPLGRLWRLWMTIAHGSSIRVGLGRWRWLSTPHTVPHTTHRGIMIRHRIHVVRRGRLIGRILRLRLLLLLHRVGCPMPRVWSTGITWWPHTTRSSRIVSIVSVHYLGNKKKKNCWTATNYRRPVLTTKTLLPLIPVDFTSAVFVANANKTLSNLMKNASRFTCSF